MPQTSTFLQELIARAKAGERDAQQEVLAHYWPLIRIAVRGRKARVGKALGRREETDDIEQTAAIKILEELPKHEWQGSTAFAAWVKKLASLEVIDRYRHHHAEKRNAGADTSLSRAEEQALKKSLESQLDDRRRAEAVMAQVAELKPDLAAALLMHHHGFTHQEIGDALDCSAEAARKMVSRAHRKIVDAT
ncbi:MAG: sigma-70 family RNA polymerase sigma factor [Deltaproteobacteria bacterium]|nr:sigma-70 family RNA polymerase sigma factor [Deltaproteobacteria bacterium]